MNARKTLLIVVLVLVPAGAVFLRYLKPPAEFRDPAISVVARMTRDALREVEQFEQVGGKKGDPKHPARKWAEELWKFREAHPGMPSARRATHGALTLLYEVGDFGGMFARAETLRADDPAFPLVMQALFSAAKETGDYSRLISVAGKAIEGTPNKGLRAQMAVMLGRGLAEQNEVDRAREAYELALREAPASPAGKDARRGLYELDHLRVGLPAPEFAVEGLDGRTVRLADFRGKAVLLDFWTST